MKGQELVNKHLLGTDCVLGLEVPPKGLQAAMRNVLGYMWNGQYLAVFDLQEMAIWFSLNGKRYN